jgi:CheY-like chemotaxis protein
MHDIHADVLHNRIYISFKGRVDFGELKLTGVKINQEGKLLKEGFGAILDFTEFVPGTIEPRQIMLGIVHSLSELGMGKAISVVRDLTAKDALLPPQPENPEEEPVEDPWEIALSVRGAEKILERFAQQSADGTTTFTKRPVVLVIDDELALLTVLSNALKRAGYEVVNAATGQKGLEQARKYHPDLIICDIMMPSPNGFKVREILSEDPLTTDIPFIFLSARTAKGDIVYALKSGGDDYITKPFDRGELLARVEAVLRRSS